MKTSYIHLRDLEQHLSQTKLQQPVHFSAMIQFFLLFSIISSLSIGEITASKVNYKKMNVSDPQGASSRGPHITYRLTRLIALFILQRKASTSSVRRGDDYKKQDESLEQVNDGLTKVLGLFQDIAGCSSSMKNDDVKKLIKDKTRLGWHGSRTKVWDCFSMRNFILESWVLSFKEGCVQ